MRRRTTIIVVVGPVACLAVSLATFFKPLEDGPRYKGFPISYWRSAIIRWHKRGNLEANSGPVGLRLEEFFGLSNPWGQPAVLGSDRLAFPVLLRLLSGSFHN